VASEEVKHRRKYTRRRAEEARVEEEGVTYEAGGF
jgi:hypothetical protein